MRNKLLVLPQETLTLSISMKWEVWAKARLRVCFSWNPISLILYLKLLIFKILPWRLLIQGNIPIEYIILFYHNFPKFFFFFFITGYQIWYPPSSAPIRIWGVMPDFSFPQYSKVWCLYLLTFSLEGGEGLCVVWFFFLIFFCLEGS